MQQGNKYRFNWTGILFFGPFLLAAFLIETFRPQMMRPFLALTGACWIAALIICMWRERRRSRDAHR